MSALLIPYNFHRQRTAVPDADALVLERLTVGYPGARQPALRHITVRVPLGASVALVGCNGAGKSSLLKAIVGLLPIHSGSIEVFGRPVGACTQLIGYLPQRGEIDWRFPITVERLLLTGRYVHLGWLRRPSKADLVQVHQVAERLGLLSLLNRQISQLSGGQQQRALLARTLVQQPELLLLDEPLNAIDADSREVIRQVLRELHQQGRSLLVATHDQGWLDEDFEAVLQLREGTIAAAPDLTCIGVKRIKERP